MGDANGFRRHIAGVDQNFDTRVRRAIQRKRERRIKLSARGESLAIRSLDDKQRGGPVALLDHLLQITQMPRRARRDAIRKLRQALSAREMHVFYFEP